MKGSSYLLEIFLSKFTLVSDFCTEDIMDLKKTSILCSEVFGSFSNDYCDKRLEGKQSFVFLQSVNFVHFTLLGCLLLSFLGFFVVFFVCFLPFWVYGLLVILLVN